MSHGTLERERGDDRDPDVLTERLHEMTNHEFRGFVSDTPRAGIGEGVLYAPRRANLSHALSGVAFRRTFIRPGPMPEIIREPEPVDKREEDTGRDTSILPNPTSVPPSNYLG